MDSNPFLTILRISFSAILAFLVWMAFWQRTHLEDQVAGLTRETSALTDRVAELTRKVDDVRAKGERLEGAAEAIATVVGSGGWTPRDSAGSPPRAPGVTGTASRKDWGWDRNAALDAAPDAGRPVGTPGRYRNFVSLDPDPVVPEPARSRTNGVLPSQYGPQEKSFNPVISTSAAMQEEIELYVTDSPASEHWADPYRYAPALCWRVEVSPDFLEYTLFFRRDATWHPVAVDLAEYPHLKGAHPVTANDFKFTLDTILNPATECAPLRAYFEDLESVTVVDEWTAVVRWKRTLYHSIAFTLGRGLIPEFLYAFDATGQRFPPETFGQQFNDHYYNRKGTPGCGPYRMLPYDGGEWIELERFDDWYGAREGLVHAVKRKRLLVYNDLETPFIKFEAGELGLVPYTASQYKKSVLDNKDPKSPFNDGRIQTFKYLRPAYFFVGWKNSLPMFRDKEVRRALELACNRQAICDKIFLGRLVPMANPVFPGSPAADEDLKPLPYDPEEAARILDAAGWKLDATSGVRQKELDGAMKPFEFKALYVSTNSEAAALLSQYRNDLRALGIVLNPEALEWSIYLEKLHDRDFEAYFGGWGTNAWDQDFEQVWHSRQIQVPKSSNAIEYANPEVDRLSDDLRTEMDVEKRKEKARRIGRLLFEDHPVCFVGWSKRFEGNWSWLKNSSEHLYKTRPFRRTLPMWVDR